MKRLILVDGNSLMYRAYFGMAAMGNVKPNGKGIYTNAVYAFARMINHLIDSEYDNILVAFDKGKHTFRHDIMSSYKAGRSPMPDEMRMQIAHIKEYLRIMNIAQYEVDLYEADDIIGTLSKMGLDRGYHVDIYSSDKDLLQLISDNSIVHLTKKGMTDLEDFTKEHFFEVYGIDVSKFIDLKAIMGDKSDNLAGIVGIGQVGAIKLLKEYNNLEDIIEHVDNIKGANQNKIKQYKDDALVTKKMVTILRDAPICVTLDDTVKKEPDLKALKEFYEYLELHSLLKEMALKENNEKKELNASYSVVKDSDTLKKILLPYSTIFIESSDANYHKASILAFVIKNHLGSFVIDKTLYNNLDFALFLKDKDNHKNTFDYKKNIVLLKHLGLELHGVDFDLMLASYILNPSLGKAEVKKIALYFDYSNLYYEEEIYGKGAKFKIPEDGVVYEHATLKACAIHILKKSVVEKLEETNQYDLYKNVELPLAVVLADMEYRGMKVDKNELDRQRSMLKKEIDFLENEIYTLAGEKFNIASPKQLGTVLFEHMALPYPKKSKGSYSTDATILESLINIHPIISAILDYRGKTKLYSTYIDGIEEALHEDMKVHTIYEQTLTQTGRLSSIEPNLQNIPIRTKDGKEIRKMFIPESSDYTLYSADYSQIELRVLAHMAQVKGLIEAFRNGEDIHTKTAREIFGHTDITADERRHAKAVNFGIVYGISAYGLATDVGISNVEAANYIKKYYEIYPEIKEFMDNTVLFAKENGYVKTLKNRVRFIPDINSKVYTLREFAKRTAMNAPIQGSAADIMKIAMTKIYEEIEKRDLKSHMILQVHDEVILEVYKGEEEIIDELVKRNMSEALTLDVPLIAESSFGNNWFEVK